MADENIPYGWLGVLAGAISLIAGTGAATVLRERMKRKDRHPKTPDPDPPAESTDAHPGV